MYKKTLILSISLTITIGIFVLILLIHNSQITKEISGDDISISHIKLLEKLESYGENSINILHTNNNLVYGTVESYEGDQVLFSTILIFQYDISNEDIEIIQQDNNKRIIDFMFIDGRIYYCFLERQADDSIKWEIVTSSRDSNYEENIVLLSGNINDVFEYPRFFSRKDEQIYLVSGSNGKMKFNILKDGEIQEIREIEGTIASYNMNTIVRKGGRNIYNKSYAKFKK